MINVNFCNQSELIKEMKSKLTCKENSRIIQRLIDDQNDESLSKVVFHLKHLLGFLAIQPHGQLLVELLLERDVRQITQTVCLHVDLVSLAQSLYGSKVVLRLFNSSQPLIATLLWADLGANFAKLARHEHGHLVVLKLLGCSTEGNHSLPPAHLLAGALNPLQSALPLLSVDKQGCRVVQRLQDLELRCGCVSQVQEWLISCAEEVSLQRWGKFVVYNWVKQCPQLAIPVLLAKFQYNLVEVCCNKCGYLIVTALVTLANHDMLNRIIPLFCALTKEQNLQFIRNKQGRKVIRTLTKCSLSQQKYISNFKSVNRNIK